MLQTSQELDEIPNRYSKGEATKEEVETARERMYKAIEEECKRSSDNITIYDAKQEYIWADYVRVCEDGHVAWVGWENQKPQ